MCCIAVQSSSRVRLFDFLNLRCAASIIIISSSICLHIIKLTLCIISTSLDNCREDLTESIDSYWISWTLLAADRS